MTTWDVRLFCSFVNDRASFGQWARMLNTWPARMPAPRYGTLTPTPSALSASKAKGPAIILIHTDISIGRTTDILIRLSPSVSSVCPFGPLVDSKARWLYSCAWSGSCYPNDRLKTNHTCQRKRTRDKRRARNRWRSPSSPTNNSMRLQRGPHVMAIHPMRERTYTQTQTDRHHWCRKLRLSRFPPLSPRYTVPKWSKRGVNVPKRNRSPDPIPSRRIALYRTSAPSAPTGLK